MLEQRQLLTSTPQFSAALAGGYAPAQIRDVYNFDEISGLSDYDKAGQGQTIAIIAILDDPNIRNDVQQFDENFSIGGAAGDPTSTKFLQVVNQAGGSTLPTPDQGAAIETAMAVEWAHAIAPGANILLVEANSNQSGDLETAVEYAVRQAEVSVVSMSYSEPESKDELLFDKDSIFTSAAGHQGITFVASSGDNGARPGYPATSPNVLAVGGTTLPADSSGNPDLSLEKAWSGSTGGLSQYESEPSYQLGVVPPALDPPGQAAARAVPDVAYDSDSATGFDVYDSYEANAPWRDFGGTSAAAPQWAALIAIADQQRVAAGKPTLDGPSQLLPKLYQISQSDPNAFNDPSKGYDLATGLGTPNAAALVKDLASATFETSSLPTPVYWTGATGDLNWDDPGNWSLSDPLGTFVASGVLPGPNNDVIVDLDGAIITHSNNSYDKIRSFTVTGTGDILDMFRGTLDLSGGGSDGTFSVPGIDHFYLRGGTLANAMVSQHTTVDVLRTAVPNSLASGIDGGVLNGTIQLLDPLDMADGTSLYPTLDLKGNWVNNGTVTADVGSTLVLGDTWIVGLADPGAQSDAWINNGTIKATGATVYLGGWLNEAQSAKNLSTLDLSTDTVSIIGTVNPPPPPTATPDTFVLGPTGPFSGSGTTSVLANDTSADGQPQSLVATVVSQPSNGTLTLHADGSFVYTPGASFQGIDRFTYRVSEGATSGNTVTVTLLSYNASLVDKLYRQVLNRSPDDKGLIYWTAQLDSGKPLDIVASGIFNSTERLNPLVMQFYQQYLGRGTDPSGLAFWVADWQGKGDPRDVVESILASPEFFADAGRTSNGFISLLYQRVLNRQADQEGLRYWLTQESDPPTDAQRFQVASRFYDTHEKHVDLVDFLFGEYFQGVSPLPDSTPYVADLDSPSNETETQVEKAIIDSSEYRSIPPEPAAGEVGRALYPL